jgi:hypothetical protein
MLETQQSIVRCLALFLRLENERHQFGAILDGELNYFIPIARIELAPKLISPARRDRKTGAIARHLPSYSLRRWSRENLSTRLP